VTTGKISAGWGENKFQILQILQKSRELQISNFKGQKGFVNRYRYDYGF